MIDPLRAILGLAAGGIAGSFLATLAIRWGCGERVSDGRSRCDHCRAAIGAASLVPLISFVALGGRCRACGGAIDRRHITMEAGTAAIGALALGVWPGLGGAAGAVFGWLLLTLALLDIDHHWLPDRLTAPLGMLGIGSAMLGLPPFLPDRLIGAACGFISLTAIAWGYRRIRNREGLGGGDPKLLAAIGAWLGWRALPLVVFMAAIVGLLWCGLQAARGRRLLLTDRLPLGALLALAAWPVWLANAVQR